MMARARTTEEWLRIYATKPLPRGVYVALRQLGPSTSTSVGHIYSPTEGMLRAEQMGLVERHATTDDGVSAFRRTKAGDTFFPEGRPYDTYEQHLREQKARAARTAQAERLARGET